MELNDSEFEMAKLLDGSNSPKISMEDRKVSSEVNFADDDPLNPNNESTIDQDSLATYYKPVDSYEGRHRWDPHFQWDAKEEKRVVRKIDWRICSWVCLMFFALQVDRGNIIQALSDDMLEDLGLTTNEYNTGQTIYFLSFILAELPSQLICKRVGADVWIPIQMVSWSLIASLQAGLCGRNSFWTTRALIGLCEGGFVPTSVLYLSYFYTSAELPVRLSYFWVTYQATSIVSALMAYGILHISGLYNVPGWRWLFGIEGALTCMIGFISYLYLPPSPTQTASKFRGEKGWFSVREEKILVNRVLRDDPTKGDMHNREAVSLKMLWQCLTDYHLWPIYLLGLTWELPMIPVGQYLTLNLRAIGFNTLEVNLLTVPAYVVWIVNLIVFTWASEWLNERFLLSTLSQVWVFPMLVSLILLPEDRERWVVYALTVLLFAQPYVHAILVGLASRNAGSVRTRTVSAALYNMTLQASNIIGSNIYRTQDAPFYFRGNKILLCVTVYNFFLFLGTKWFYVASNRKRERIWNTKSSEEREKYLATTSDEGNKRLDFRFAH